MYLFFLAENFSNMFRIISFMIAESCKVEEAYCRVWVYF